MKSELIEQWNNQCAYCGSVERKKELTIDHVVPLAKEGTDEYTNLVPACRSCNMSKGHSGVRQWYFDSPDYTTERWLKIKQHMDSQNVFTS